MEIEENFTKFEITLFDEAQKCIISLLNFDSFKRFVNFTCKC